MVWWVGDGGKNGDRPKKQKILMQQHPQLLTGGGQALFTSQGFQDV